MTMQVSKWANSAQRRPKAESEALVWAAIGAGTEVLFETVDFKRRRINTIAFMKCVAPTRRITARWAAIWYQFLIKNSFLKIAQRALATLVGRDRRPWRQTEQDKENVSETFEKYLYWNLSYIAIYNKNIIYAIISTVNWDKLTSDKLAIQYLVIIVRSGSHLSAKFRALYSVVLQLTDCVFGRQVPNWAEICATTKATLKMTHWRVQSSSNCFAAIDL